MVDHSKRIIDHGEIEAWAKANGGKPALVADPQDSQNGPGILLFPSGATTMG